MIIFYEENGKRVDNRHTVDIKNRISYASAIQVNADGTYEEVTYMTDDMRTYRNEAIIDTTKEEEETYRKYRRQFRKGDRVIIARGRKMKGETKMVASIFTYRPQGTYGWNDIEYLLFTDHTKVNKEHCDFV
jgi:predicted lipase